MRSPTKPRPPATLREAALTDATGDELGDEASLRHLAFAGTDLSGAVAESVEFTQCTFRTADLTRATLPRLGLTDCSVSGGSWANAAAEHARMLRVRWATSRLTGLQWIGGVLRDVTFTECRADLASFRFTTFHQVVFDRCNLARADFQNADLGGVVFAGCDLTAAQFSQAKMMGTRFAGCTLAGVGGVACFAGAIVSSTDLAELSYSLATALGITVEVSSP